jgi:HAMP domain-containing protein
MWRGALLAAGLSLSALPASAQEPKKPAGDKKVIEVEVRGDPAKAAEEAAIKELETLLKQLEAARPTREKPAGPASELDALKAQLKKLQDEVAKKKAEVEAVEAKMKEAEARRAREEAGRKGAGWELKLDPRDVRFWRADGKKAPNLPPGVSVTERDGKLIIEVPLHPERKPEAKPKPGNVIEFELVPAKPGAPPGPGPRKEVAPEKPREPGPKAGVEDRISALEKRLNALIEELHELRKEMKEKKTSAAPKKETKRGVIILNE